MAISGTPTSGNDTLTSNNASDKIIGEEGNDSITGGGGNDTIYGDIVLLSNGGLDSNQSSGWSLGAVNGWYNSGSSGLIERWADGFLGLNTNDGSSFIELDAQNATRDHLQTDVELGTGVEYILTLDAAARNGSGVEDDFEVTHNGTVIATISPSSTTYFSSYSITLTGLSGTDTIGFREISSQNNGVGVLLDNINISLSETDAATSSYTYDDVLNGGNGSDQIYGQEGNDTITGGAGNDFLVGGIGSDVFVLKDNSGNDFIDDFTVGEDRLNVQNLLDASGATVDVNDVSVSSDGQGGSVLTFPNGETLQLRGIAPSQLDTNEELRAIGIPCFVSGTMMSTPTGMRLIDDLSVGDMLTTCKKNKDTLTKRKIRQIFKKKISHKMLKEQPNLYPVRISAGALGLGYPQRDLLVSRQHRMLINSKISERMFDTSEVLIPAIKLTKLPGIFIDETVRNVEYYHLLLNKHEVVFAEGAPTESLFTGAGTLDALDLETQKEILKIFPEVAQLNYVPKSARLIPDDNKQKKLIARLKQNQKPCLSRQIIETAQVL